MLSNSFSSLFFVFFLFVLIYYLLFRLVLLAYLLHHIFVSFLLSPTLSVYSISLSHLFLSSLSKVVDLAEGLLQSRATKARGLSSASLLLQPKNQVLLQVSNFIVRLREGVRYALSISDTTQSEKFAEAKAAWASVQTLLLEATKVKLKLN